MWVRIPCSLLVRPWNRMPGPRSHETDPRLLQRSADSAVRVRGERRGSGTLAPRILSPPEADRSCRAAQATGSGRLVDRSRHSAGASTSTVALLPGAGLGRTIATCRWRSWGSRHRRKDFSGDQVCLRDRLSAWRQGQLPGVGPLIADALQAPAELRRVASYDNVYSATPHRIVEFTFDSAGGRGQVLRPKGDRADSAK